MDLRDGEEARLVVAVGRAFQREGIHTKILGYDHNWSLHPTDVGPPGDAANPEYAASLLANPAARHHLVNDDWGTTTQHVNVSAGGQAFSDALPAGAVATFVLPRGA